MPRSSESAQSSTPGVVVDTNLFVRGLLKGPVTTPLIQAWRDGRFQLVTSEEMISKATRFSKTKCGSSMVSRLWECQNFWHFWQMNPHRGLDLEYDMASQPGERTSRAPA